MRFRTKTRRSPIINIVSLIDILCIVLIFFVVTTVFRREEPQIKFALPESSQAKTAQQSTPEIISVTEDEKLFVGDKPMPPADLADYLKSRKAENPAVKFALKASKRAPLEIVVKVMDAASIAGFTELPMYTADPSEKEAATPAP
jgi:biopolymer transport protein ExbD